MNTVGIGKSFETLPSYCVIKCMHACMHLDWTASTATNDDSLLSTFRGSVTCSDAPRPEVGGCMYGNASVMMEDHGLISGVMVVVYSIYRG